MDLATLGIAVDSKPLERANDNLQDFTRQATAAERAAERWGTKASGAAAQVARETTLAAKAADVAAVAYGRLIGKIAGGLVSAFGIYAFISQTDIVSDSLKALGKTWSDLFGVGAAAAVPLAKAIDGLAYALDNPVFRGFVHTIGELLFGAMSLSMQGLTLLVDGFNLLLANFDAVQVAAATAGAILLLAFGPAILSGIAYGFGVMAAAGIAAINGITAAIAANPLGALAVAIVAAVTALYVFRDEIQKAIGVDVIGIVKRAANYFIGAFVAAYGDIKFLWASFPDIIGAAVIGAVNAVARGIHDMLQESARQIDWLIDQVNKIPGVKIGKIGDLGPARQEPNPYADRLAKGLQTRGAQQQEELSRDYLGALGTMFKLSAPGPKSFTDDLGKAGKEARALQEETDKAAEAYRRILAYGQNFIALQEAERAGIGLSAEAAARLRYEQELLNQARRAGIQLTPEQLVQLQSLAAGMAAAEQRTRELKEAFEVAKSTVKGFLTDFRNGLEQGKSVWESFGNAALNALQKISDKLFENAFGGAAGGSGGGWFAGLFSSGGGASSGVMSDSFANALVLAAKGRVFGRGGVTAFARGGVVDGPTLFPMANGAGLMGEAGPEAVMPLRRGRGGRLGVSADNDNAGGIVINMPVTFGSDVSRAEMGRWVGRLRTEVTEAAIAGVERKRRRGGSIKQSFGG